MKKKTLLINAGGLAPNGITISLRNLLGNIDYTRYDVTVIFDAKSVDDDPRRLEQMKLLGDECRFIFRTGRTMVERCHYKSYREFIIGNGINCDRISDMKKIFIRESNRVLGGLKFDVAIDFSGYSPFWAAFISCSPAGKTVCYQHSDLWAEYTHKGAYRDQSQLLSVFSVYNWFDSLVSVSDEVGVENDMNLKKFYPRSERVTVRNTIDVNRIRIESAHQACMGINSACNILSDSSKFVFISLGRLSPEKRHDRLIAAFAKVHAEHKNARLLICGDGPLESRLKKFVRKLDVEDSTIFTGHVTNPYHLLAASDACVLTSDYEGQGLVLLEALALGVPCIGTDTTGIRSVLKNGRGRLVAPTSEAFASAMAEAIYSPQKSANPEFGEIYSMETMEEFRRILEA